MSKAKPIKAWEQRLKVRVSGFSGVLDMMRYDNCFPATEQDAHKLAWIAAGTATGADHVVEFLRRALNDRGPTVDRWRSYACEVLSWEPVQR